MGTIHHTTNQIFARRLLDALDHHPSALDGWWLDWDWFPPAHIFIKLLESRRWYYFKVDFSK
jgi:hypothetical protein